MVLFVMSWKVAQFMTIQRKAMQEHSDELNNITSINPRFLTIQTKTIKNTINFSYIFPKNSNHEGVYELKFRPVSCHGY